MRRLRFCLASFPVVKLALCIALIVCVGSVQSLWAQAVDTGIITGIISDQTGAVVAGATVTATDNTTGQTRTVDTGDNGRYTLIVPVGTYNVAATKTGFSTTKTDKQEVTVARTYTLNFALRIGGQNVVVEVTATGTELQTTDATVGQTITGLALDALPTIGRDVSTFITLQPGVSPDGSVAGGNQDQNSFTLDGGNNSSDMDGTQNTYTASFAGDPTGGLINNEVTATSPAGSPGAGGPTGVMPTPADSIEEFRVGTNNQTADFNSSAGAQVKLVTKRGTNAWHGSVYQYYLDNNWAGNTFDNNLAGIPRLDYHYNRFGGSIGGKLPFKDFLGGGTYIFANYEGFRWPNSATTTRLVPSPDMRLGVITDVNTGIQYNLNPTAVTTAEGTMLAPNAGCAGFTGGVCDPRGLGISPAIQQLFSTLPAATITSTCLGLSRCDEVNTQAYTANYLTHWRDDFGVMRVDHDFSSKWHFYGTYRYYHQKRLTGNQISISPSGAPASDSSRPSSPWFVTASLNTTISSNVTNDFHYSFLRNFWARNSLGDPINVTGANAALEPEGESSTNVLAPTNLDTQDVRTRFWDGEDHMLRDDVSWIKGNHFIQFGGLYQHNWDYHQRTDNGGGINYQPVDWLGNGIGTGSLNGMVMNGFEPAGVGTKWVRDYGIVLGVASVDQIAYTRTGANLNLNPPNTPAFDKSTVPFGNLYISDSWRIKPSFTFTYGLGWTLEMPPSEAQGKQIILVDAGDQPLDTAAYLNARSRAALAGSVYNPEIGAAAIGAVAGPPSHLYNPYYHSFSPRIAAAWNPKFDSGLMATVFGRNQTVVRGGYSILYGRLNGVDLVLVPLLGTGLIQAVQCVSPLSNGTCAGTGGSTPGTAFRIGPTAGGWDGLNAPIPAGAPTLPQPDFPGYNASAAGPGEGIDPNFRPSKNMQYDVTIQRQINNRMSVEIGYIGRHMTHEFQPVQINAVPYMMTLNGQRFDKAYGQMVMQYCGGNAGLAGGGCAGNLGSVTAQPFFETALGGTTSAYCSGFTSCTQAVAANEGNAGTGNIGAAAVWSLWSDLDNGAFTFPRSMLNTPIAGSPFGASGQLTSDFAMNTSLGYGNYNGAFVSYKMSGYHGLTLQSNFTWSKALGTVSQVQATSSYSIDDPFNFGRDYGYQPWDRKFLFNTFFAYQPPYFKDQHGIEGRLLGGWTVSPILDVGSGLPLGIYATGFGSSVYDGGQEFGGMDGANVGDFANAVQFCGGHLTVSRHNHWAGLADGFGGNSPGNIFGNPEAAFNCFRNPILGIDNGRNGGPGNLRGLPFWNVDMSVRKNLLITERVSSEFNLTVTNVFNHNQLYDPNVAFMTDPADFGSLEGSAGGLQVDNPRRLEISVRVRF